MHMCVCAPHVTGVHGNPCNEEGGTNMDFTPSVSQGTGQSPIESPQQSLRCVL